MRLALSIKLQPSAQITLLTVITILINLLALNHLYAEETEIRNISGSTLSWGRKYFFDAPSFRNSNVQELLDEAISRKLKSYDIQLAEGNTNSKYVLAYTVLLGDTASQADIKDLYAQEPELKEISEESSNYEQGKLLISIRDRETHKPIWKNSVEGFANLDMANELREQRVRAIVDQAFATFPVATGNSQ